MSPLLRYPSVEAWRADGVNFLGASEAAAILGKSPWEDALGVYARKTGLVAPKEETLGLKVEPLSQEAIQRFKLTAKTGLLVTDVAAGSSGAETGAA